MSTVSHPNPTPVLSPPLTAAIIAGSVIVILSTAVVYLVIYHRNRRKQSKYRDTEADAEFDANDIVDSYGDRDDHGDNFRTSSINTAMVNPPATPRASDVMQGPIANDPGSISERGRSRHRRSLFESTIFRLGQVYSKRAKKEQSMLGTNEMVSIWLDMLPSPNQESVADNDVNRMMPRQTVAPQPILRNRANSMPSMRPNRRLSTEYTDESYAGSSASNVSIIPPVDAGLGTGLTDPRLIPRGSLKIHRHSTDMSKSCNTAPKPSRSSGDSDDAETIHFPHLLKRAASLRFRRNTTAALTKSKNPYSPAAKRQTFRKHTPGSQSLSYNMFTDYGTSIATQRGDGKRDRDPETKRPIPPRSKSMPAGHVQVLPIESQPDMETLRARARTTGVSEQEMTRFLLHEYRKSGPLERIILPESPKTSNKENVQPRRFPIPQQHVQKQQGIIRRNTAVVDGRFTNHLSSDHQASLKRAKTTRSAGTRHE